MELNYSGKCINLRNAIAVYNNTERVLLRQLQDNSSSKSTKNKSILFGRIIATLRPVNRYIEDIRISEPENYDVLARSVNNNILALERVRTSLRLNSEMPNLIPILPKEKQVPPQSGNPSPIPGERKRPSPHDAPSSWRTWGYYATGGTLLAGGAALLYTGAGSALKSAQLYKEGLKIAAKEAAKAGAKRVTLGGASMFAGKKLIDKAQERTNENRNTK
ncbi:MAG: hypothetical protein K2X08_08175 [Chlamydiales bacterium]|nr:hypothetical protein [Chlamydiales bacterium]